jgi:quercetin dioxygenase-like cupin family protein
MIIVEMKGGQPSAKPPKHSAWDARETSPEIYDLMLINPEVRVLLATWEPGQEDKEHSHPALAAYALTDITAELTDEDGNKTPFNKKAGDVLFQDPVKSHTFKNLAETPAKLLLIELRR